MTTSWLLKLGRAEEHFLHIKELLPTGTERKPHPVRERFDPDENGGTWRYTLALDYEAPERLFVVIGDFLFNVRSALDHMAAACVAPADKHRVQFPIFWEDALAIDPATGGHVNPKAWNAWKGRTKPLVTSGAVGIFEDLQPFKMARQFSEEPEDHVLSVLAELQDTDKHQNPVVAPCGLFKIAITINGNTMWLVPGMHDGELLAESDTQLDVQIEGALHVGVGVSRDRTREITGLFDEILNCIANDVLPPVESFLGV